MSESVTSQFRSAVVELVKHWSKLIKLQKNFKETSGKVMDSYFSQRTRRSGDDNVSKTNYFIL